MSRPIYSTVIAAASVLGLAFFLNPSPNEHRSQIRSTVAERSPIAGVLGVGTLTAITTTYHSVGVASYTTSGEKIVSYGAFGMVVVPE